MVEIAGFRRARSREADITIAASAIEHGAALWTLIHRTSRIFRAHALSFLAGRRRRCRLAIDRPRDAEAVDENAKSGGPERLVQRHLDDPALCERIEHPACVVGRRGMDDQ